MQAPGSDLDEWQRLKVAFKSILDTTAEEQRETIIRNDPNLAGERKFTIYIESWRGAREVLMKFFGTPNEVVFSNSDWRDILLDCEEKLNRSNLNLSTSSIGAAAEILQSLILTLRTFIDSLQSLRTPIFGSYSKISEKDLKDEARQALKKFIRVGETIRNDANYNTSYTKKLEDMLVSKENIQKPFAAALLDSFFVALAAPSMEGKTQSAFVFQEVKPLYFPLSVLKDEPHQYIYLNFRNLTATLKDCAATDLKRIGLQESFPSTSSLSQTHSETQFLTLGFLKALADKASRKPQNISWMEYYANIPSFQFNSASIRETNHLDTFKTFVLMLDEFDKSRRSAFVRNLARATSLTCIVANTNTRIANVVGRATSSGSPGLNVWSLVITHLDPASRSVLDSEFYFSNTIDQLIQTRGNDVTDPVCRFLNDLKTTQIQHLRAGVAAFVSEILLEIKTKHFQDFSHWSLGQVIFFIGMQLAQKLPFRKLTLIESKLAMRAHLALLLPEAYVPEESVPSAAKRVRFDIDELELFKDVHFLENHLFYIINPCDRGSWQFFTFPPFGISNPNDPHAPLSIFKGSRISWDHEYSEFKQAEFLSILGCLLIPLMSSCAIILDDACTTLRKNSAALGQSSNPIAFKLDGNSLEVSAAFCIAKATHKIDAQTCFNGISARSFILNIIYEMIRLRVDLAQIQLSIPEELETFLDGLKVPFIYSISYENATFEKYANIDGFLVQTYNRTADESMIDGKFDMKRIEDGTAVQVVVECKNRRKKLGSKEITPIVTSIYENHAPELCFIFCGQCTDYTTTDSALTEYCKNKGIDIYRFRQDRSFNFMLVPFCKGSQPGSKPSLICIVFENKAINPLLVEEI